MQGDCTCTIALQPPQLCSVDAREPSEAGFARVPSALSAALLERQDHTLHFFDMPPNTRIGAGDSMRTKVSAASWKETLLLV